MNTDSCLGRLFLKFLRRFAWKEFVSAVTDVNVHHPRIFGDPARLSLHPTSQVNDAFFNVISGRIKVGEYSFFGHGVSVITGTHDIVLTGAERKKTHPDEGRDVTIGDGVWVCSNATILGPCNIGRNAVIGAMSLVRSDVPENAVVAGIPARIIRILPSNQQNGAQPPQSPFAYSTAVVPVDRQSSN